MENIKPGYQVFNYIDKPGLNMNDLVAQVETSLSKKLPAVRLPYFLGFAGGIAFDILSKLTGKKFPASAVRVKKFCATTQFDATSAHSSGFKAPFTLSEGLHHTLQYKLSIKIRMG